MSVVVVGANHRTASLDLLERMAVTGDRLPKLLHDLDAASDVSEAVVLATCNRTEVYLVAEKFHGAYSQVRDFFSDLTYLPPDLFAENLYVHYDDVAVRHLFEVAAGLDSAVPGEHEILGQVGDAWEVARCEGTSRRSLNLLFRRALEVGKRARTETGIARHVTSVSQAAVLMADARLGDEATTADPVRSNLSGTRALVIGAGSMARGMASFAAGAGVAELVIANRTRAKADELVDALTSATLTAEPSPPEVIRSTSLDSIGAELASADVVLTATDSTDPIITVDDVRSVMQRRNRPLLIVDVAMPRDVEAEVAELADVTLLDMDTVAALTEANLAERHKEAAAVRVIVEAELDRFASEVNAREVAPLVTALRERAEEVRRAELDRFAARLSGLDPDQRDAVEALTRGLLAKVLHTPTVALKDAAGSTRGDRLTESVRDLFDLS